MFLLFYVQVWRVNDKSSPWKGKKKAQKDECELSHTLKSLCESLFFFLLGVLPTIKLQESWVLHYITILSPWKSYFGDNENVPLLKYHRWHTLNITKGIREKQVQRSNWYCKLRPKVIQDLFLDFFSNLYMTLF